MISCEKKYVMIWNNILVVLDGTSYNKYIVAILVILIKQ